MLWREAPYPRPRKSWVMRMAASRPLIIARQMFDLAVAEPAVERLGAGIIGAHLQVDDRDASGARHLLLPLNQTPPYPQPAGSRPDRKQVQMGPFGVKLHDGKADQLPLMPGA